MSDRDLHQRASALFLEVRDTPAYEREQRLREAAAGDDRLVLEVQSLLANDDQEQQGIDASTHQGTESEAPTSALMPRSLAASMPSIATPARIGPYRVIERIGRGGSGYVLLAEQERPVRRRVAIKIVPHAAISPDLAARFEFERRALESVEHPNIARILDAGQTPDGLPYLVMDYVQGTTITEHCRRQSVGLRERIGLMLDVADAVQHAHQRGVIHRDLKPGNILVSTQAGADGLKPVCQARVVDFGIAKPIAETWHGGAAPATIGMPLGTPAYMAPEQTGGGGAIDTRADVYALGATLYELTCGRPPIDIGGEVGGDAMDVLRRIRESVPPSASRVRAGSAALFADDPMPRSMLLDLDCILARALEKSPDRRYPTASAFADDLRRLVRREPIVARPATLRYRAARFTQRNRVLVGAAALVTLAMMIGIIGLTAGLLEARREQRIADIQTEAQIEINKFLTDDLLAAASPEQEGRNVTALQLLNRASRTVDLRFAGRPLIAAAIHHTLGEAYAALAEFDEADGHLQQAVTLRRAAAGPNAPETVRSELAAASLLLRRQRLDEADVALVRAITRARLILGDNDLGLFAAINDLGVLREAQDRTTEAIALLEESLRGRVRLLGPRDRTVFGTVANLAQAYDKAGDKSRAISMLIESLHIAEGLPEVSRMTLIELNNNIGATYQDVNQPHNAAPYLRKADDLARDWLSPDSVDALTIRSNLAALEGKLGNRNRALELLDEITQTRTRVLGPAAYDTLSSRHAYWSAMWGSGRFDEAAAGFAALLPDVTASLKDDAWLAACTRLSLARALVDAHRSAEALPHAERAAEQFMKIEGPTSDRTSTAVKVRDECRGDAAGAGIGASSTSADEGSPRP